MRLENMASGKYPGAVLVASALESAGITHTFGIPGTHNIELYDALTDSDILPVLITDEQSAGFMADGMVRSGGAMACVNIVPGAGLTHALSGIAEAYMDNIPMLVLLCGIRDDIPYSYQLHDIDQLAIAKPVVKQVFRPEKGEAIPHTIIEAVHLAQSGCPGPVAVEIPANYYLSKYAYERPSLPKPTANASAVEKQVVEQAIQMLQKWKRPLLHLGMGAAGAVDLLVPLAEKLGAVVSSTISGKGVFPESHPLWLWPGFGDACPPSLKKIANECDGALIIGARMGEVSTASFGVRLPPESIQVDIDGQVPGKNFPVGLKIQADAKAFVQSLLGFLGDRQTDTESLRGRLSEAHDKIRQEQKISSHSPGVTPALLFEEIQLQVPPSTIYVTDSGNGTFLAMENLRINRPHQFLIPSDFSCMGYCVPSAIGAALAHPDRIVVAFPGDGALLMTGLEWLTAAHHKLPIIFFVLRDRELGQIAAFQKAITNRTPGSILPDYNLSALAAVAGIECLPLEQNEDISKVIASAYGHIQEKSQPIVVEVAIDYSRKTYFTKGVVKTNFLRLSWPDRLRLLGRAVGRKLMKS